MKYVVKFNNGYWKVFDTVEYKDVQLCYLRKEANDLAGKLNAGK